MYVAQIDPERRWRPKPFIVVDERGRPLTGERAKQPLRFKRYLNAVDAARRETGRRNRAIAKLYNLPRCSQWRYGTKPPVDSDTNATASTSVS